MKTYLVTGGAGFIGSSLVSRLLENYKVVVIDNFNDYYDIHIKERNISEFQENNNFKLYKCDIRNKEELEVVFKDNKIDCVIHLAAYAGIRNSINNPNIYTEVNVIGTQNLLEIMKDYNVRKIVFSSSSSVYGNSEILPLNENMDTDSPLSPYAATKKASEVMLYTYHSLYNIDVIILRLFTVYGPRQRPDLAIYKFTKAIMNNEEITMYKINSSLRDYTYIDDVVDAFINSIYYIEKSNSIYEIMNIGSNKPIKLIDMIDILAKNLNKKPNIKIVVNQLGDVDNTHADIHKAKSLINYIPKTNFDEGIKKFIEWFKKAN